MQSDRLDRLPIYPFQRMDALFADLAPAAGIEPINMSIGDPQHEPPALLAETVAANNHLWSKYPTMPGTPDLREAMAEWLTRRYGLSPGLIDPAINILPLAGTKEGLFLVALALVPEPKDGRRPAVLMPDPAYPVYEGAGILSGADLVYLPATERTGFLPDLDGIDAADLDRAVMMYLCTPSNPEGAVASMEYMRRAVALARQHDFTLVVDECYAEIYFADPPTGGLEAAQSLGPGPRGHAFDNVVVFHSLSKRSSAAGLRAGFVAGDPAAIRAFFRVRRAGGTQVPGPIQAAAAALWRDEPHVVENRALYRSKFEIADRVLGNRFGYRKPGGGFFLWLNVGDGEVAATRLWTEAAVKVLPGAYLTRTEVDGVNAGVPYIRVALVHDDKTVEEGLDRITRTLEP